MILKTKKFTKKDIIKNETIFTTANGNLGFRGDTEEKDCTYHKGTYINGFFDTEPIQYGEPAYGYAVNHETIINLPDPKRIELDVNGYSFTTAPPSSLKDRSLALDTETGILTRHLLWTAPDKSIIELKTERLVSFTHPECALIIYSIKNIGSNTIRIKVNSSIDTAVRNIMAEEDPRVGAKFSSKPLIFDSDTVEGGTLRFTAHTRNSGLSLSGTVMHIPSAAAEVHTGTKCREGVAYSAILQSSQTFTLQKYITYIHKKTQNSTHLKDSSDRICKEFCALDEKKIKTEQAVFLSNFRKVADIKISGDKGSEEALNFNVFQLLQSVGKNGKASIAAKGLTGEGYEGHFFWDTEAYICPVFTYTAPEIAESLLAYRASILPEAKKQAEIMSLKGALYPWRTIDGEETSAYFPAGTAQYHIDADIIFALNKFLYAEGRKNESDFNAEEASLLPKDQIEEMAVETARMWLSLGFHDERHDGKFCINDVTGPDEYTAIVNNNAFTNLMARENLYISCRLAGTYASEEEKAAWKHAADTMYIPFDKKLGIYPQDDSFLSKEPWDFQNTPKESYPLLMHYHPLVIYRHRVLKQADLVLVQFFLSALFTRSEKIRNFDFYEPYTTGDSSLSHCIQSIMACEIGDIPKAFKYFNKTIRMDLDDVNGNVKDGIHTACMAGSWLSVVYGFAGFRDYGGKWTFNPQLPGKWKGLSFSMRIEKHLLTVTLTHKTAVYQLRDDDTCSMKPLRITHRNESFILNPTVSKTDKKTFSFKPVLRAVLFDLDGVITDTAELHYQAWLRLAEKNKLKFDRKINKQLLGIPREASLEIILRKNNVTWAEEQKKSACREKNDSYVKSLDSLTEKDILPGIKKLLEDLKTAGIKTGLASASRNAPKVLHQLKIGDLFTAIADAGKIQMPKPEPDIFLAAAEQCGVWYTDCVGIEDAEAGIAAINKAGMQSIGVCTNSTLEDAAVRVRSTSKLTLELLRHTMEKLSQ